MKIPTLFFKSIHVFGSKPLIEYRLLDFIHCCDRNGQTKVKIATLAKRWRVSYRTAARTIHEFREKGLVRVSRQKRKLPDGTRRYTCNLYQVMLNFGSAALQASYEQVKLAREAYARKKAAMKRAGIAPLLVCETSDKLVMFPDTVRAAPPPIDWKARYEAEYGPLHRGR